MQLNAHLSFNGQCQAALRAYEQCLGGSIVFMTAYGDSPMADDVPAGWHDKIVHATLRIGDSVLTAADVPPDAYRKPQGFSISLTPGTAEEAERIFNALAENGTVEIPLQETFWALRFGMLVDRFGTPW